MGLVPGASPGAVSRIGAEVVDSQTDIATAFCPFDQATQDDYVAGLERARAERIFYSAWVIARYDDIDAVLRDPVSFSSKGVLPMSAEPDVREAIAGVVAPEGTLIGGSARPYQAALGAGERVHTEARGWPRADDPRAVRPADRRDGARHTVRFACGVLASAADLGRVRPDWHTAGSVGLLSGWVERHDRPADRRPNEPRRPRKQAVIDSTLEFHGYIAELIEQA
jgi:hypothetical protein